MANTREGVDVARDVEKSPYILALDVGTSSTRALLFDSTGASVPNVIAQRKYEPTSGEDGELSVDADFLVGQVAETIDEALRLAGERVRRIAAVAMDTFWHSMLAIDSGGRPLTPCLTWADTRPRQAAAKLRNRLDKRAVYRRTGVPVHASYWPAKLAWLSEAQPDVFLRAARFVGFGEYLLLRLLGAGACSMSMASGTGLLVTREKSWDDELLRAVGVTAERLPPLCDLRDTLHGLTADYRDRWPALHDVPWVPAIGDGAAANVGSGCAAPGRLALTVGTSSAVRAVVPLASSPEPPEGLWLYLLDSGRAVLGGAHSEGGNVFAWLEKTLHIPPLAEAEEEVATLPPDSHGLTILPFIAGERSLGWHAEARATVAGVHAGTTPQELLRAGVESVAYRISLTYRRLVEALSLADPRVIGSGGALLNSALFQQVLADTLGVPLFPSRDAEASARGAALIALEVLGVIPDVSQVEPHLDAPVTPDAERGAIYRRAAERQQDLYQRLLGASEV